MEIAAPSYALRLVFDYLHYKIKANFNFYFQISWPLQKICPFEEPLKFIVSFYDLFIIT